MTITAPTNPIAREYAALLDKRKASERTPTDRCLAAARRLLEEPQGLVATFRSSVEETTDYFARHDPGGEPFYDTERDEVSEAAGLESTAAVGALMEKQDRQRWDVLGDDTLSFYYIDRELLVTQAKGLAAPTSPDTASLRLDLLLASASDGLPIVAELKVTTRSGSPDKNPSSR